MSRRRGAQGFIGLLEHRDKAPGSALGSLKFVLVRFHGNVEAAPRFRRNFLVELGGNGVDHVLEVRKGLVLVPLEKVLGRGEICGAHIGCLAQV